MMGMDAGWYRDPAAANPTSPTTVRYWDGQQWTAKVRPASRQQRAEWRTEMLTRQLEYAVQNAGVPAAAGGYAAQPDTVRPVSERDATPDGEPLAGWWIRVGAVLIDSLLTTVFGAAFGWPFIARIRDAFSAAITQMQEAARTGGQPPAVETVTNAVSGPLLGLAIVFWLVSLVYGVGFLKAYQATPGKLLLGLAVRLRDAPGPLSWRTVLVRWFARNLVGLVQLLLPLVAPLTAIYSWLDSLWPLWDSRRQALHDKLAGTNVVRRR